MKPAEAFRIVNWLLFGILIAFAALSIVGVCKGFYIYLFIYLASVVLSMLVWLQIKN